MFSVAIIWPALYNQSKIKGELTNKKKNNVKSFIRDLDKFDSQFLCIFRTHDANLKMKIPSCAMPTPTSMKLSTVSIKILRLVGWNSEKLPTGGGWGWGDSRVKNRSPMAYHRNAIEKLQLASWRFFKSVLEQVSWKHGFVLNEFGSVSLQGVWKTISSNSNSGI